MAVATDKYCMNNPLMDLALSGLESREFLTALTSLTLLAETRDEDLVAQVMEDVTGEMLTQYLLNEVLDLDEEDEEDLPFIAESLFLFTDLVASNVVAQGRELHSLLSEAEWIDRLVEEVQTMQTPMALHFSPADLAYAMNEWDNVFEPRQVFGHLLLGMAVERTRAAELEDYTLIEGSINVLHHMQEAMF